MPKGFEGGRIERRDALPVSPEILAKIQTTFPDDPLISETLKAGDVTYAMRLLDASKYPLSSEDMVQISKSGDDEAKKKMSDRIARNSLIQKIISDLHKYITPK